MSIVSPIERSDFRTPKHEKRYGKFQKLIAELQRKDIPDGTAKNINDKINALNLVPSSDQKFSKNFRKTQQGIINTLLKEVKIVPKNYYRNLWLGLGMAVFGVPLGVAFGAAQDNMAFLGIGIPIGMGIGIAIGTTMDEQAKKEGRQLDIDLG